MMDKTDWKLLKEIADLEKVPQGAYNIRLNGQMDSRSTTANIDIATKTDGKSGIDIRVKPGTKHESVHIPVLIHATGFTELVYNDFFIGEDCDIDIVAGCGIHNTGCETAQHDGLHTFYIGKNSKVRYVERHYGEGEGTGQRIFNPQTVVYLEEGASIQMETTQIRGVDSTKRDTRIVVGKNAEAVITEAAHPREAERRVGHGDRAGRRGGQRPGHLPLRGPGRVPADLLSQDDRQLQVLRPCAVRLHHHGGGAGVLHPGHRGPSCGCPAHPRGGHRPHRRGSAS